MSTMNLGSNQTEKTRLGAWINRHPLEDTSPNSNTFLQRQHNLANWASNLEHRYNAASKGQGDNKQEQKAAFKIASKISTLTLDALDSSNPTRIAGLTEWFNWLEGELFNAQGADLLQAEVDLTAFLDRIAEASESHNRLAPLLKDSKGIDARVLDDRSGDRYYIKNGGKLNSVTGAQLCGYDGDTHGNLYGNVDTTGGGNTYEVTGQDGDANMHKGMTVDGKAVSK